MKTSTRNAGSPPLNSRSDFTRLSSRDLYGTGSRLHSIADGLSDLKLVAAARHYRSLAHLEDAGSGQKTGQSPLQTSIEFFEPESIWPKGRAR
jgi:hypothetical protein